MKENKYKFNSLSKEEKEKRFQELINYSNKIKNEHLRNVCINILNDYKKEISCRGAGHDGIENIKYDRTHHMLKILLAIQGIQLILYLIHIFIKVSMIHNNCRRLL